VGGSDFFCFKIPFKEMVRKRVKMSGTIANTWDEEQEALGRG
jgi:hypothetical protein